MYQYSLLIYISRTAKRRDVSCLENMHHVAHLRNSIYPGIFDEDAFASESGAVTFRLFEYRTFSNVRNFKNFSHSEFISWALTDVKFYVVYITE